MYRIYDYVRIVTDRSRQINKQTDEETDRLTVNQADRQTDRQIKRIYTYSMSKMDEPGEHAIRPDLSQSTSIL